MASGGHVDRIAAEFGVHFVGATTKPRGRHESRARRTCQKLLKNNGAEHLRLVFGLINTGKNRGNWSAPCFTAVSWLLLNRPELERHPGFLEAFDRVNLGQLMAHAKRTNPKAPTVTMSVLLTYEIDRLIAEKEKEQAA